MKLSIFVLLLISINVAAQSFHEHPIISEMLVKNNSLRSVKGLTKQHFSESLALAAQDHAWYMAYQHDKDNEDFEHRGNNGTPGRRAARYCFRGVVKENIARGYMTVGKVFEAWESSSRHYDAIYSETSEVGFGYAVAKDGTTYWVGLYGEPEWRLAASQQKHVAQDLTINWLVLSQCLHRSQWHIISSTDIQIKPLQK